MSYSAITYDNFKTFLVFIVLLYFHSLDFVFVFDVTFCFFVFSLSLVFCSIAFLTVPLMT